MRGPVSSHCDAADAGPTVMALAVHRAVVTQLEGEALPPAQSTCAIKQQKGPSCDRQAACMLGYTMPSCAPGPDRVKPLA